MKAASTGKNFQSTDRGDPATLAAAIKEEARRLGFDGCGISRAEALPEDALRLCSWLERGHHAGMAYMERQPEKRVDPTLLFQGARSVVSVLLNYYPSGTQTDPEAPVLAKYAYGKDYHVVVREKLNRLLKKISSGIAPVRGRAFVDTAPLLEKAWAARAGLGWIGKNTCLISPGKGSFCFIGTLLIDIPLQYDRPVADLCGDCTLCIDACPAKAIVAPRTLDAGHCISYLTIESRPENSGMPNHRLAGRVFGCDICQDVCPWNRSAAPHHEKDFDAPPGLIEMTREDWFNLNEEKYKRILQHSAVQRIGFEGLKRNLERIAG
ncbi:MAG: tRNA epoxyqueuosine(34) reductase QueG [Smithellaceae bacterium]|jgi:epoxyqueuosine reductase|nr:tRNA epoxyqueuosine(34) reductase QueG [Smithellaceae bacterium]MDD3259287.1 tRNA epoxyqueuosine(34) reductase QueG [Smithellaceae bacterium]MDD3847681.1 tRNA epoxyqueuosine(34) reductase QueG [Smithellaceae bacterium]HOG12174.1 tRNA epoxyqueuosine(34) reductase QueG [Smithellaceae bacterium]HOQ72255.1 tRNA epoxyqueuosine(34) reductase QueG [Smithellaceae bacterium]